MTHSITLAPAPLDELRINTLRFPAVDMVLKANSCHPGLPAGSAAMAYALWDRSLRFKSRDPLWPDRDRFVLPAGHGCALLYALLHVTGFDSPEERERFRQWGSRSPSHPEYGKTAGVGANTGPLGQEFANAVGMKAGKDLRSDISEGTNNGAEQRSVSGRKLNQRLGKVVPQTPKSQPSSKSRGSRKRALKAKKSKTIKPLSSSPVATRSKVGGKTRRDNPASVGRKARGATSLPSRNQDMNR